ncbi:B3 domain-containing protein Os01g0723500 isoform X2 [Daucus carota subsp. sativus]|uniref:B3 domain-containing protein Os01g0723500 isoform X2 n=1 Tax=Daucus carota subsp. sativus TaxID=79200 RepID=UPI0007F03E60|nr:PREDICTED: B3 domain-containing protein Os01g0723500-like isoform X2 [Daucus carota subsp. sativus]
MGSTKMAYFLVNYNPISCSHMLKVPPKFIENMEGYTCGTVSLEGPSGDFWHASLIKHDNDLCIYEGWQSFVRDHFLEDGDTLLFGYEGDLQFVVQVFDQSSCEKEAASTARCSQDQSKCNNLNAKKRESVENTVGYPRKKMRSSQVPSDIAVKERRLQGIVASMGMTSETSRLSTLAEYVSGPSKNSVAVAGPSVNHALLSATEADRIAQAFTSLYPTFTKVMKRFNVSGSYTLNIPYQFSMAHLPKCKVQLILRNEDGKSWVINSIPNTRVQTSHTFCGGWLSFVRDNTINMGDICIFELVQNCEFLVRILRVQTEGVDNHSNKSVCKMTNNSCATQKTPGYMTTSKGNSRESHAKPKSKAEKSGCNKNQGSNRRKNKQLQQSPQIRSFMSMKSAPEEKIAAESFLSNLPHFVRIMKKFNISGSFTMKVPCKFSMEHLPSCRTEIVLRNIKGDCWTVNSVPTMKVQTLHTFCGGWMAFVRDNDIQMGDICIFELIGKCEMRVHISSYGRKDQEYQGGRVASNELALMVNSRPLLQGT